LIAAGVIGVFAALVFGWSSRAYLVVI
jgi:hypothetical protein